MLKHIQATLALATLLTLCTIGNAASRYELRIPGTNRKTEARFDHGELIIGTTSQVRYFRAPQYDGQGYRGFQSYQDARLIRWPLSNRGHFEIGNRQYGFVSFRTSQMAITPISSLPQLRSKESITSVKVSLHNKRQVSVEYYWINFQGQKEYVGTLAPSEIQTHDTFATHPWVLKVSGRVVDTYIANTQRHQYVAVDRPVAPQLQPQDLVGTFIKTPYENDYHIGELTIVSQGGGQVTYRWKNGANATWLLHADLNNNVLHAEPSSPYYNSNPQDGRTFEIVTSVQHGGQLKVDGFRFLGQLYRMQ